MLENHLTFLCDLIFPLLTSSFLIAMIISASVSRDLYKLKSLLCSHN